MLLKRRSLWSGILFGEEGSRSAMHERASKGSERKSGSQDQNKKGGEGENHKTIKKTCARASLRAKY